MIVTEKLINQMYKFSGVNQEKLIGVLKSMDPMECLESSMKKHWTKEKPFYGYSYYIAEFLYFYVAPKGSKLKKLFIAKRPAHYAWFIQWPDNTVIDLTISQYENIPEYGKAKVGPLMYHLPQVTTQKIAEGLGFSEDDLDV